MSSNHILSEKSQGDFNAVLMGNHILKHVSGNTEGIFFFLVSYWADDELLENTERPVTKLQEFATKFKQGRRRIWRLGSKRKVRNLKAKILISECFNLTILVRI